MSHGQAAFLLPALHGVQFLSRPVGGGLGGCWVVGRGLCSNSGTAYGICVLLGLFAVLDFLMVLGFSRCIYLVHFGSDFRMVSELGQWICTFPASAAFRGVLQQLIKWAVWHRRLLDCWRCVREGLFMFKNMVDWDLTCRKRAQYWDTLEMLRVLFVVTSFLEWHLG